MEDLLQVCGTNASLSVINVLWDCPYFALDFVHYLLPCGGRSLWSCTITLMMLSKTNWKPNHSHLYRLVSVEDRSIWLRLPLYGGGRIFSWAPRCDYERNYEQENSKTAWRLQREGVLQLVVVNLPRREMPTIHIVAPI
jgi:hypothetical protein